jgi:hypothetical protein
MPDEMHRLLVEMLREKQQCFFHWDFRKQRDHVKTHQHVVS